MPLHDAAGMNCNNGATTENQGAGVKYMGCVCIWAYTSIWAVCQVYDYVCYLTLRDYPALVEGESHCIFIICI